MSKEEEKSTVINLLQPDLLTEEELREALKLRCCRVENVDSFDKDRLVDLYRRVVLPLPQRLYRTNRRGTLLTARRMKAGLCGSAGEKAVASASPSKNQSSGDRLKPPPDLSNSKKIRTNAGQSTDLDKIVINDRRKSSSGDSTGRDVDSTKVSLKRTSENSPASAPSSESKKQRTLIKWP